MHVVSKTCKRKYYVEECCIITFSLIDYNRGKTVQITDSQ